MAVFLFALGLQYNNEKVAAFFVDALRSADGMREDRCVPCRAVPCRAVPCRRRGASCETGKQPSRVVGLFMHSHEPITRVRK
jgi:hypothetical protein